MTINDMTTAPRDGSEVLIKRLPDGRLPVILVYDGDVDSHTGFDLLGWLDIDAMARDAERLNHILRNQGQCELHPQPWIKEVFDATCDTCPSNITEWEQAWLRKARSAIDKEMDNGA